MDIIKIFAGVLLGIYLGAEKPELAVLVWDTAMHWIDMSMNFLQTLTQGR